MITNQTYIYTTFSLYLLLIFGIGWYAWRQTRDLADYFLGGRRLGRWTTAISAGASDMSGWLLLGLPGYAYIAGLKATWIALGLLAGTWLNWRLVAPKLRIGSEACGNALTLPEYLENRFQDKTHLLRILSAVFILFFFMLYTSSGLVAGGKLFESVFGLSYSWAVIAGTVAILLYTTFGGFLAVSWTDLLQGLLMAFALVIAALLCLPALGGLPGMIAEINKVDPAMTDLFRTSDAGPLSWIAIVSLLGWGLGYFGQPHILVRFMAIRSDKAIPDARKIAVTWTCLTLAAAIIVGCSSHGLLPGPLSEADSEKVFIELVTLLFHPVPAGICLAGILAAIMSTADSQLLVSSSAFTKDLYQLLFRKTPAQTELVRVGRIAVVVISVAAAALAMKPDRQVLDLVAYAWAGFGATFGPVILLSLYWNRMTRDGAVAGMLAGGLTVIVWKQLEDGIFELYELVPGFVISTIVIVIVNYLSRSRV
ncbi:MAG: sodium/proline symporter PutP [Gammaproteobacteria bacterium]